MNELTLKDGQLAFQHSPVAFRQWIDSLPITLTGSQWLDLLLRVVKIEGLESSAPIDFLGAMQEIVEILLAKNLYSLAYQLYSPLLQDPSDLREYRLNPQRVSTWLEHSLLKKEKQSVLCPEEVQQILRIRELLLELDPQNITNILCLIRFSGELRDSDSVKGYTALGCSILADPFPVNFVEDPYLKRLLGRILALGYAEDWLELMTALVPCRPISEHPSWYAWLEHLAAYYAPHYLENYAGLSTLEYLWNPQILSFWKDLFREAQCRGFSLLANGLHRALTHLRESDPFYLSLQAEVVYLYRISAQPEKANPILEQILETWSLERLSQEPTPTAGIIWILLFQVCPLLCYATDDQPYIRHYQQKVAHIFSQLVHVRTQFRPLVNSPARSGQSLRVGYLSNGFHRHSVGYLSHESLACHHPDVVSVYGYYYGTPPVSQDPLYLNFKSQIPTFREVQSLTLSQIIDLIRSDHLDILVYMDTLTAPLGCEIIACRVAPVQISWLGGDSPGLPEIDYFLVDPWVLAETAQQDYQEKLLRLSTFATAASFEVSPISNQETLDQFQIPAGKVILWTASHTLKRSSDSIEAHIEILKQVPEAVLVVKGIGDLIMLQDAYESRGGPMDRIRFIPITFFSEDHRAQLQIADLVLDTFPYTGATHTLEALYMGVPVLTLVGQHYNGRMSYSLLKNLGLDSCITWSQAEYIQRGIELGRDPIRLAKIKDYIKLTYPQSPLSDVQGFANQLEDIYLQICPPKNR